MATTVGAVGIHASKDLLMTQVDVQLAGETVKQLVIEFDQRAFDAFNTGNEKVPASEMYLLPSDRHMSSWESYAIPKTQQECRIKGEASQSKGDA